MIPGDLLSAFAHRQFHTLPGLLDSWAALPNSNPNACVPMQGGSLYRFYDGLRYVPAERRTHDLPCERRTRYRLSQPDTVSVFGSVRYRNGIDPPVHICKCIAHSVPIRSDTQYFVGLVPEQTVSVQFGPLSL